MEHVRKRHDVSLMLYHQACPAKYRRKIIPQDVSTTLKQVRLELG